MSPETDSAQDSDHRHRRRLWLGRQAGIRSIDSKARPLRSSIAVCGSKNGLVDENGLNQVSRSIAIEGQAGPEWLAALKPDVYIDVTPTDFRTGGAGLQYAKTLFSLGCDLIAVSKGALVKAGPALQCLAEEQGSIIKLSGASGAALPCLDLLKAIQQGATVVRVEGVFNATSAGLLNSMFVENITLQEAISRESSADGASMEKDVSFDLDGWDAACKTLLIANFGLGARLHLSDTRVKGISKVTPDLIKIHKSRYEVVKLVGILDKDSLGEWQARVETRSYPAEHPFASLKNKTKGILISTDEVGDIFASGAGSEPKATAASVLKDFGQILQEKHGQKKQ